MKLTEQISVFFTRKKGQTKWQKLLSKHKMLKKKTQLFFYDRSEKMKFTINAKNVLYIKSSGNYVKIYFLEKGKIKKEKIRTNLKKLEKDDVFPMLRCHRSYMINASKVKVVRRSTIGLKLQLDYDSMQIPLSSKYKNAVINILHPSQQKEVPFIN